MTIQRIYIGGWFQRTTLHLSEIYDFLKDADSPLDLDKAKLKELQNQMNLASVEMRVAPLDYILAKADSGIELKIFEDGLMVLSKDNNSELAKDIEELTDYYSHKLSPGISYIFSLGAPIPKELANIKTIWPYFVVLNSAEKSEIENLLSQFHENKYFEIREKEFEIYRGNKLYIINNLSADLADIETFIQERIFIHEFKGQLHRYLNLHRIIWEKIADVKERGSIRGSEVGAFKDKIESYGKTINLIETRMNQMGAYIKTRASIVKGNKNLEKFLNALDFKHETLADTLAYIKDIWVMTKNYVKSALDLFTGIQAKSTESSVRNLTVVTSMGVGATLIGLFSQKLPKVELSGVIYFAILVAIGYLADRIMKTMYRRRKYQIRDTEIDKDIK